MNISTNNRRYHERYKVSIPIKVFFKDSILKATLIEVSATGGFLISSNSFPFPTNIKIKIKNRNYRIQLLLGNNYKNIHPPYNYSFRFVSTSDTIINFLNCYLTGEPINDPRNLKNRRTALGAKPQKDNRDFERRYKLDILRKALLYNRAHNLQKANLYPYYRENFPANNYSTCLIPGKGKMIMFSTNSYLGLGNHPDIKRIHCKVTNKYGIGCNSSRLLGGSSPLHTQLEKEIADWVGCEAAITFPTGYLANLAIFPAFVHKGDVLIIDDKSHASIHDGSKLCKGEVVYYRHNNMASLEKLLIKYKHSSKLIGTDGVFSMDGDIAKLDQIYELARKYNAATMIDDAHGIGILGETGAGTTEYFGLKGRIDFVMATLSKSLSGIGGFVAGRVALINYLKHVSRPILFIHGLPPSYCASTIEAIKMIRKNPETLCTKVIKNAEYFRMHLQTYGFDTGLSETPIVTIILDDEYHTLAFNEILYNNKIFVSPILHPAVPKNKCRLRFTILSTHTKKQLDYTLEVIKKAGKTLNLI